MSNRMSTKRIITDAVLSQLPDQGSDTIFQWWMTGRQEGLRLSEAGDAAFRLADLAFYTFPTDKITADKLYPFMSELNRKIKCPYYLGSIKEVGKKAAPFIRIYDSKIAMMMNLYGSLMEYLESLPNKR